MIDEFAKEHLHDDLRWIREVLVRKLDGLSEYAPGHVPWWPRPDVKLFNILVHLLGDTTRHAGHADILREQLDGRVGTDAQSAARYGQDSAVREARYAQIEQAARAADPAR